MFVDLAKVDEKGIVIDDVVSFGEEYIKKTPIQKLDNIKVTGRVYYSVTNEVVLDVKVEGKGILSFVFYFFLFYFLIYEDFS